MSKAPNFGDIQEVVLRGLVRFQPGPAHVCTFRIDVSRFVLVSINDEGKLSIAAPLICVLREKVVFELERLVLNDCHEMKMQKRLLGIFEALRVFERWPWYD